MPPHPLPCECNVQGPDSVYAHAIIGPCWWIQKPENPKLPFQSSSPNVDFFFSLCYTGKTFVKLSDICNTWLYTTQSVYAIHFVRWHFTLQKVYFWGWICRYSCNSLLQWGKIKKIATKDFVFFPYLHIGKSSFI